MNRNLFWLAIISLTLVFIIGCTTPPTGEARATPAQCKDRVDNDGDGYCDYIGAGGSCNDGSIKGDPDCSSANDNSECTSQCTTSSNCGTAGYVGSSYCGADGNVYRDYRTYTCTTSGGCGTCSSQTTPQLQSTCTSGCTNGACNAPAANSCSDTDGGRAELVQGTVSGTYNGVPYSNTDACSGNTIQEYYCLGTVKTYVYNNCLNATLGTTTCSSGACS